MHSGLQYVKDNYLDYFSLCLAVGSQGTSPVEPPPRTDTLRLLFSDCLGAHWVVQSFSVLGHPTNLKGLN